VSNANIELKSKTLVHGARYGLLLCFICFYRYIYFGKARYSQTVSETIKYKTLRDKSKGRVWLTTSLLSIEIVF